MGFSVMFFLAYLMGGITYIPLTTPIYSPNTIVRVQYYATDHVIAVTPPGRPVVKLTIGSTTATVGEQTVQLDAAPFLLYGVPYVSQETVSKVFGQQVQVNPQSIVIDGNLPLVVAPLTPEALQRFQQPADKVLRRQLMSAVIRDEMERVGELLTAHPELISLHDKMGDQPIHLACRYGYQEMAELLLAHGATLQDRGSMGRTPLHIATNPHAACMSVPLPEVSDPSPLTSTEEEAVRGKRATPAVMVEYLLGKGGDIHACDIAGYTPLLRACGLADGGLDVVKILLAHGADTRSVAMASTNDGMEAGSTVLHWAAWVDNAELIKLLQEYSAQVDAVDSNGDTPLHIAIRYEHLAAIKQLLTSHPTFGLKNKEDLTSLELAKQEKNPTITTLLQQAGAK